MVRGELLPKKRGGNGVKYDYLALPKGYQYTERVFARLRPWEKALALELEETLGHVRAQSDALVRISKMVKALDKRRMDFERDRVAEGEAQTE